MFKKLGFKIRVSVLLTLVICCLSIYLISVNGILSVLETHFMDMADQILVQKVQNLVLFQESIQGISSQIAREEKIQYLLSISSGYVFNEHQELGRYQDINRYKQDSSLFIDGKILPYKAIEGAAVFSAEGDIITTSDGLSTYLLDLLKQDSGINSFFKSKDLSYWSVRSDHIPDYYRNNRYTKQKGIVSYIKKVDYKEHLIGYIVIDINPEYFYGAFAPAGTNSLINGISVTLIGSGSKTISSENSYLFGGTHLDKEGLISFNKVSLKYVYSLSQSGVRVGLNLPADSLQHDKFNVFIFSTFVMILSLAASFIIAVVISKNIVDPIRKLHKAMKQGDGSFVPHGIAPK